MSIFSPFFRLTVRLLPAVLVLTAGVGVLLSAAKPAAKSETSAGQLISGAAGVTYSFRLPAALKLSSPGRDNESNFTEFTARLEAAPVTGESAPVPAAARPFRFDARIIKLAQKADCAALHDVAGSLTRTLAAEQYKDQSPSAPQKFGGTSFLVKVFHKEIPPDHNQKSAALHATHLFTSQGNYLLELVFLTDARDEAGGQALKNALLKSLKLGSGSGAAVCKPAAAKK